jgi:hypothetical protein
LINVERLSGNLDNVKKNIADAALRAGRDEGEVCLVAVTKTVDVEVMHALYDLGVREFAENRAQVAKKKIGEFDGKDIRWHFIGHLQRNKVKDVFPQFNVLHSLDSLRLAKEIQKVADNRGFEKPVDVFLEVKVSEENSKLGVSDYEELKEIAGNIVELPKLNLIGVMAMAPFFEDMEKTRKYFSELRQLRDSMQDDMSISLPELSMGMSNDYEIAVEEGATMVRVGSALFEGVC